MIHYHGTPLTPRSELEKLAGKNFCVPFSDPRDADWCLKHGQSVMWDSGAFTAHKRGTVVDWRAYYAWLEPRLDVYHWAVIPDVIDGSIEEQAALVTQWPFERLHGQPVWHMGLSIDYLLELAQGWPRLCFGSSRQYWQVGSDIWCRRADEAFNALEKRGVRPAIHMLRGLALAGDRWPFASADSVNVATSYAGYGHNATVCPERMARRIDAVQCPLRWSIKAQQQDLFNVA